MDWKTKAAIDLMGELQSDTYLGVFSETANSTLAQYVTTQVKDKLLNDWKQGTGLMAAAQPKFIQTADTSEFTKPREPLLKMCSMTNGHLTIPKETREKWLQCPVRSNLAYITDCCNLWYLTL